MSFAIKKDPKRWIVAGTGPGIELCPKDTSAIILGLNDLLYVEKYGIKLDYLLIADVLDEKPQVLSGQQSLPDTIVRINRLGIPLIAPYKYEEIPLSQRFPIEQSVERFGLPYFTNSICYMICFALLNGAKEISTYGINQASQSEYFHERDGVTYWLGIANGMGVKVTINGEKSELLRAKPRFGGNLLYGWNTTFEELIRSEEKFGEGVVKKLLTPPRPISRTVRKIN